MRCDNLVGATRGCAYPCTGPDVHACGYASMCVVTIDYGLAVGVRRWPARGAIFQKYSSMVVLDTATAVQRKNRIDLVCTYYDKVRDEQFRASSVMCTSQHSGVCIPHLTQYQTNRTALGALNF